MLSVNQERLQKSIEDLASRVRAEDGACNRLAYSAEYERDLNFLKQELEELGLKVRIDAIGNLFARLEGSSSQAIVFGSHIDTVPDGGFLDGSLGVMAGIELLRVLKENNYENKHSLELAIFIEEEGNTIGGLFGSKVFTGAKLDKDYYEKMKKYNLSQADLDSSRGDLSQIKAFVELHIEQGGILEAQKKEIGVVQAIVGIRRYLLKIKGRANHAGTCPMYLRDDALLKAAKVVIEARELALALDPDMVATIGRLELRPAAINVIPGEVEMSLEIRAPRESSLDDYEVKLAEIFPELELELQMTERVRQLPRSIWQKTIEAAEARSYSYLKMFSGAGHDAMLMSDHLPTALIFIPSKAGISHAKEEFSSKEQIEAGANILLDLVIALDQE